MNAAAENAPLGFNYIQESKMKKYLTGFVLGLATITTLTFAIEYSDIDWYGVHRNYDFKEAIEKIIENCKVNGSKISC